MVETAEGPGGLRIEFDDKDEATPVMVYLKSWAATFWCAQDTGYVDAEPLTQAQLDWLDEQEDRAVEVDTAARTN